LLQNAAFCCVLLLSYLCICGCRPDGKNFFDVVADGRCGHLSGLHARALARWSQWQAADLVSNHSKIRNLPTRRAPFLPRTTAAPDYAAANDHFDTLRAES
jgi:hypothetical protein